MTSPTDTQVESELEQHRRELTGYCYRMLGGGTEAEDAVQETMALRPATQTVEAALETSVASVNRALQRARSATTSCRGSRLIPLEVNGTAGSGSYRMTRPGLWEPFAVQVVEVAGGQITGHHNFLYPQRFAEFGLPPRIED